MTNTLCYHKETRREEDRVCQSSRIRVYEALPDKSIITDNGNKFSSLGEIEGLDVYFAHAYSSYDQGTNEHFNGLLREFISKGINERPKRILGYQSAKKAV